MVTAVRHCLPAVLPLEFCLRQCLSSRSVYLSVCPGDPTCSNFGFYQGGQPTPMMEKCLLYKMCLYGEQRGAGELNSSLFTHAFTSKYRKVRIFKVGPPSHRAVLSFADPPSPFLLNTGAGEESVAAKN
eukprot:SAG22_NODE_8265_length_669_cov_1.222807_2_plen_129_part_00